MIGSAPAVLRLGPENLSYTPPVTVLQAVAICRWSTGWSTTEGLQIGGRFQLFVFGVIILAVSTGSYLLPKQMLYQAELHPEPGSPSGSPPSAQQKASTAPETLIKLAS